LAGIPEADNEEILIFTVLEERIVYEQSIWDVVSPDDGKHERSDVIVFVLITSEFHAKGT
jgi:hypothetical protein